MPKVSVIIPVYGVEKYIEKCLDSVLCQDYDDFEIIAIDDESPDNCGKILDEYAEKYGERIHIIHQKNTGQGGARNRGIEESKGKYLLFVDSDDYIAPDMLFELVTKAESTGADIVVCGLTLVDESGRAKVCLRDPFLTDRVYNISQTPELIKINPSASNKLWKREMFIDNDIRFPERVWYEDIRTTVKLIAKAETIVFIEKCPYFYLQREGSTMHNSNIERNREIFLAFDDITEFLKQNGGYDFYYTQLEQMIAEHVFFYGSKRVIDIAPNRALLNEFSDYTLDLFPEFFKNKGFREFIRQGGIKRRVICLLLCLRLYRLLHFMLRLGGQNQ